MLGSTLSAIISMFNSNTGTQLNSIACIGSSLSDVSYQNQNSEGFLLLRIVLALYMVLGLHIGS